MANMHEAKKIFQPGDLVRVHDDYTSATILYFKSMFVALDELLRNKLGRTPKDHTERFRMLEKDLPLHYRKLIGKDINFRKWISLPMSRTTNHNGLLWWFLSMLRNRNYTNKLLRFLTYWRTLTIIIRILKSAAITPCSRSIVTPIPNR